MEVADTGSRIQNRAVAIIKAHSLHLILISIERARVTFLVNFVCRRSTLQAFNFMMSHASVFILVPLAYAVIRENTVRPGFDIAQPSFDTDRYSCYFKHACQIDDKGLGIVSYQLCSKPYLLF